MHIGMRTIKTAVGTAAAMLIAYSLHLEYWAAAGIITILSVQNTTKASFRLVAYHLLATLLGFVIAIGAFLVLGYNAFAFGVFLVIFIPITNVFAVQSGIVMTAVLVTHFMMARSCSWFWIKNELLLLAIGAGVALIANLFMPSLEAKIMGFQKQVEAEMREIIDHMSQQLGADQLKSADNWANLSDLKMTLDAAVAWANRHSDNQLLSENDYYQAYFEMRANQYELLRQMQDSLDRIETPVMQAAVISDALAMTASVLNEDNPAAQLVTMVKKIQRDFAASPLPTDRASFESRARLFYFLEDFSRLLQLKRNFNHIISSQN